ncbi:hypothetical protein EJ03DRAFT_71402 [Teratosphaeria nubilosa]|uniref:Uncharacterized protein n=1 Tax=Teratosphaeria nubilosa TaxID=161662 RepID=A0A6G1LLW7_9PEZI|nr:hypothetical protein EJ03DRAFT_71402 [Teratosphaeria nubilosa]
MFSCTNSLILLPALPTGTISSASTLSWRTFLALGMLPSQTSRLMNAMAPWCLSLMDARPCRITKALTIMPRKISRPTPVSSVPSGRVLVVLVMFASFILVSWWVLFSLLAF